jgi:hypothetical protein
MCCKQIKELRLEGLRFGNNGRYKILNSIGRGWEGCACSVEDSDGTIRAVKIIPLTCNEIPTLCPTWTLPEIDLRKNSPFNKAIEYNLDWFDYLEDEEKEHIIEMLKWAKNQQALCLIVSPMLSEVGVVLVPIDNGEAVRPTLYLLMPYVRGLNIASLLSVLADNHLVNEYLYRSPIRSSLDLYEAHRKLAEECVERLITAFCQYYKKGILLYLDVHMENVLYGRLDRNNSTDFYIIDTELKEATGNERLFKDTVIDLIKLAEQISTYDLVGVYSQYEKGTTGRRMAMDFRVDHKTSGRAFTEGFKKKISAKIKPICKDFNPFQ